MTSPILASTPRKPLVPAVSVALIRSPVMKSSFTANRTTVQLETGDKAASRKEGVSLLDVTVNENVLPGHKHVVHHKNRVILVKPARQWIIERTAEHGSALLVGDPADKFYSLRIGGVEKHEVEVAGLDRKSTS